ncbi:MAG: cyclopropane-fatty-acyl-phospholipid synthase family protein, partial [Pseudomonadota bacterium]
MFPLSHMMKSFIRKGRLDVIDADGKRHTFAGDSGPADDPHPVVTMRLSDKALYRDLVFKSEIAAAEGYMDGTMTFEEGATLRDFLKLFSINRLNLAAYPLQKAIRNVTMLTRKAQQSNKRGQAQQNVSHHYDLGNEFYKLFLDDNMLYSCAYFRSPDETLEQAQRNKLRLIAAKLNLKPGQRVLDIGCGWGDMALYLASMEDVHVTGVTLSTEQQKLATERAAKMGLSDRVEFRLQDYREVPETFDRIVSVGMFEHVGVAHYDEFFAKLNDLMPDDGLALIHSIGHMSPPGMASKFMRKYIFPGAYSPALSEVFESVEKNSLWCSDLEFLRVHYADTLKHWEQRFQSNRAEVEEMYDERFARMWEFYLISAEAMFRTGSQLVFHMQLSRSRDAAPLQRDYAVDVQREYEKREKKRKLAL